MISTFQFVINVAIAINMLKVYFGKEQVGLRNPINNKMLS